MDDPDILKNIVLPLSGALLLWLFRTLTSPKRFTIREKATGKMIKDMRRSRGLVFLGVKHDNLLKYLKEAAAASGGPTPWKTLDVYFADPQLGRLWAGAGFDRTLPQVISEMVKYFHDRRAAFPALATITFYENVVFSTFSGSLFRSAKRTPESEFDVIYSVLGIKSPASQLADTKNAFTSRLKRRGWGHRQEFDAMKEMYSFIQAQANRLLEVKVGEGNEWNRSVDAWAGFLANHPVYDNTMKDLLDLADVKESDRVLELGSGTGRLSKRIADKLGATGALVLVDNAVQMLEASRKQAFRAGVQVQHLLSDVHSPQPLYGPARALRYDKIICHFSFHHFIDSRTTPFKFAHKWQDMLAPGGTVILTLHDTLLADCNEPYPDKLRDTFAAAGLSVLPAPHGFRSSAVASDFKEAGYELVAQTDRHYPRTYRDRVSMWRSPMILKGIIEAFDYEQHYQRAIEVLEDVERKWGDEASHPTTVQYMIFRTTRS